MSRRNPKVLLLYPPNQSWPNMMCKPNGSLAYPNLAGALLQAGIEVKLYDACVGNEKDNLDEVFYRSTPLPTGLRRTGVSNARIIEEAAGCDIVGLTSIFSEQETMVLATARAVRQAYPEVLLVAGGVNARARKERFFAAGFDIVCLSEAEKTLLSIVAAFKNGSRNFGEISALAFKSGDQIVVNPAQEADIVWDLDQLPMPAWHLLPNERYWKIGRPHGGFFAEGTELRYASMMTSLGCPFHCSYCHIGAETKGSMPGAIGRYRIKSDDRVLAELDELKRLGVKQVFVEDDSLFGQKRRSLRLLRKIRGAGFQVLDVNGVNLVHLLKDHEPDTEVLEALVEAGFTDITLPFESANPRIIRKYASNKWDVEHSNVIALIKACRQYGLRIEGNYMIGYPDETREEIQQTLDMAKVHFEAGIDQTNFFCVMPLPGTPLFDMAVAGGYLPRDYNPDEMNWMKATMKNTLVPPEELEEIRQNAWLTHNPPDFVKYKLGMVVAQK